MKVQPKILVADDSLFIRKMLIEILANNGFVDVIEAGNGKEALELYRKNTPDLIMIDLIMPEMGGLDVLYNLSKEGADVKVIVVTAVGGPVIENETKGSFKGVVGYISKPFKENEIMQAVKGVLALL
jgi:two-component system chemotaxis response regulator CheY